LANPVYFLPYYEPDAANIHTKHILFGNTASGNYLNPYAEMLKGYKSDDRSSMYVQFELKQNLDFITKGLFIRGMFNINRFAQLEVKRQYNPFFYALAPQIAGSDEYKLIALNPDEGTDYLDYVPGEKKWKIRCILKAHFNMIQKLPKNIQFQDCLYSLYVKKKIIPIIHCNYLFLNEMQA
jgi:hypothetical protein